MVDAFTTTGAASLGTSLVQTAYDRKLEGQLRHAVMLRQIADKHPQDLTSAGNAVVLQRYNDLPEGNRKITETVDPDAVAVPSTSSVTIAYEEWGLPVIATRRLAHVSLSKTDPIIVDTLAYDMQKAIDGGVGDIAYAGTNVTRPNNRASTATVVAGDKINSADVRKIVTTLRVRAVAPKQGEFFVAYVHPNVALDLRQETGAAAWRDSHVYTAPDVFWSGETGRYEGAIFVESARMKTALDGAAGIKVYRSLFAGRQALAEAVWEEPHSIVNGTYVDKLNRFMSFGWYGAINWAIYRQEALERYESAATL